MNTSSTADLVSGEETQSVAESHTGRPPADYGSTDNAPPSYESLSPKGKREEDLIGKIKRAKQESLNYWEFSKFLFTLCVGSVVWSLVLVLTLAIPLAMLILGITYINECPRETHIPVFLVVGGAVSIFSNLLNVIDRCQRFCDTTPPDGISAIGCITSILNSFSLGWFIAGCVWVYRIYQPSYSQSDGDMYCNKTLYLFSFWLLNSCFIFVGVVFLLGLITMCITMIFL